MYDVVEPVAIWQTSKYSSPTPTATVPGFWVDLCQVSLNFKRGTKSLELGTRFIRILEYNLQTL